MSNFSFWHNNFINVRCRGVKRFLNQKNGLNKSYNILAFQSSYLYKESKPIFTFNVYIFSSALIKTTPIRDFKSFPNFRRILKHLKQTTFEIIVTKEEIAHNKQFLPLQQYFQLNSRTTIHFYRFYHIFAQMLSEPSAAELLYVGKG